MIHPPVLVERKSVDIVDQDVGVGREGDSKEQRRRDGSHLAPLRGSRLINALVSSRPPPIAWSSA